MPMERVTITVREGQTDDLRRLAENSGVSVSQYMRFLIDVASTHQIEVKIDIYSESDSLGSYINQPA